MTFPHANRVTRVHPFKKGGNAEAVRILLEAGADPDGKYYRESTESYESASEVTTSTEVKAILESAGAEY